MRVKGALCRVSASLCRAPKAWAKNILLWFTACFLVCIVCDSATATVRIKDLVDIQGVRVNQLVGYGLVVGLEGTGDGKSMEFTQQSVSNMLEKMGVSISPGSVKVDNVAAVMVTAALPAFARPGAKLDCSVSSMGDADSLYGGTLVFTPLRGADGKVYAVAQGPVSIGGFSASGAAARVQKNFPTVGRVVGGAMVERQAPSSILNGHSLCLTLKNPDFTTASRIAGAIDQALWKGAGRPVDSGTVELHIPERFTENLVELLTTIENLKVTPDGSAKVVVNERTGTVVIGRDVRISKIAIAHGNLSIEVREKFDVSQPEPFSDGETVVTPDTAMSVGEESRQLFVVEPGVSITELVRALNSLGVSPRDLITIFQALKASGALKAELELM
jgi:flagellar P-ring protein FlgI